MFNSINVSKLMRNPHTNSVTRISILCLCIGAFFFAGCVGLHKLSTTQPSTPEPIHTPTSTVTVVPLMTPMSVSTYYVQGIKINADKTLSVNGKKTFPVFIYAMCHPLYPPCDSSKNTDFLFSARGYHSTYPIMLTEIQNYRPLFEANKVYWVADVLSTGKKLSSEFVNSPYFFGYQSIDEPSGIGNESIAAIQSYYNAIKAKDPNHPVLLSHWKDMYIWYPFSDILMWDTYTIRNKVPWAREDAIYAWELYSKGSFFQSMEINSINKPVYAVLQANGIQTYDTKPLLVPTPAEVRALTYSALTVDVKGIGYWGYHIGQYGTPGVDQGLVNNPSLHAYYKQIARELKSLNDVLVLPTAAYSWYGHEDWVNVSLNPNPSKTVDGGSIKRFSYLLKKNSTIDKWYLFIVNKDSTSLLNVKIRLEGLTGAMTARTLGLETTGSQRANRIISVSNGVFKDSFDGYAAHIYEISYRSQW